MQQTLSSVLFPGYRRRVLRLLLLRPDEALHGREIARRTGLPSGTLARELVRLAQAGLLKREKRGNQFVYSAERKCPVFEELASILRKTSGVAEVLAGGLAPAEDRIRTAFIFGSMGRGDQLLRQPFDMTTNRFGEAKDLRFPHHIIFVDRTAVGLFGNLSRLRAAAPWRRMLEARLA